MVWMYVKKDEKQAKFEKSCLKYAFHQNASFLGE